MFDVSRVPYFIFVILLSAARGTVVPTKLKFVANFPLQHLHEALASRGSNAKLWVYDLEQLTLQPP
jgi:hypothetical protein